MLTAKDVTPMLQAAKEAFKGSKMIALIGPSKCGKTVIAALLYHSIVNEFLPTHSDYRINVERGLDFLQTVVLSLKKGEFPVKTPASEIKNVDIVLSQALGTGGSLELRFHDTAGEVYQDLYAQELPADEIVYRTLYSAKGKDMPFGEMSFLIFCKMYIILIDCQYFDEWAKLSFDYVKLLNAIFHWKHVIGEANNGNIRTPVAVMFTKIDLLDEEKRMISAEELLRKYMPEFYHQLNSIVDGQKGFFKVHLDVKRGPTNQPLVTETEPPNFMVETPIVYSADEYIRFISWVDNSLK